MVVGELRCARGLCVSLCASYILFLKPERILWTQTETRNLMIGCCAGVIERRDGEEFLHTIECDHATGVHMYHAY
jgi:hypothetical protein